MLQRSKEWLIARLSCITGTRFKRVLGTYSGRCSLIDTLIEERKLLAKGPPYEIEEVTAANLEHGRLWEDRALAEYQLRQWVSDDEIDRPALVEHKKHKWIKVSPDFIRILLDSKYGCQILGEIKCPVDKSIHESYRWIGLPAEYRDQVQGNMWVTKSDSATFISYFNDTTTDKQLIIHNIERDDDRIRLIEESSLEILHHVKERSYPTNTVYSIPDLFPTKKVQNGN